MKGAFYCFWYVVKRLVTGKSDPEKTKAVPYYLDMWTFTIVGAFSVTVMSVLIL